MKEAYSNHIQKRTTCITHFLRIMLVTTFLLSVFQNIAIAQEIYLPNTETEYIRETKGGWIVKDGKWLKWVQSRYTRNKKGLVTSITTTSDDEKNVDKYKYTYKNDRITSVTCYHDGKYLWKHTITYKGDNNVIIKEYDSGKRLEGQRSYTFKNKKISLVKYYNKKTLTTTCTFSWNGEKLKKVKGIRKNGSFEQAFTYKGSWLKKNTIVNKNKEGEETSRSVYIYNQKGYLVNTQDIAKDPDGKKHKENSPREYTAWYKGIYPKEEFYLDWIKTNWTVYKKYTLPENYIDALVYEKYMTTELNFMERRTQHYIFEL